MNNQPSEEEVKAAAELKERSLEVSKKIQEILLDSGFGIQPVLEYSSTGIMPGVRLVEGIKKTDANKTRTPEETGTSEGTEGIAEPEQA